MGERRPDDPYQLYDWKHKIYLQVVDRLENGFQVVNQSTGEAKVVRFAQIGPTKRYRSC